MQSQQAIVNPIIEEVDKLLKSIKQKHEYENVFEIFDLYEYLRVQCFKYKLYDALEQLNSCIINGCDFAYLLKKLNWDIESLEEYLQELSNKTKNPRMGILTSHHAIMVNDDLLKKQNAYQKLSELKEVVEEDQQFLLELDPLQSVALLFE